MSGTVDTRAIIGSPPPPSNPIQILSGWQDYANKIAQNAQIKASTANTEQNTSNQELENQTNQQKLAQTMVQRHNQVMFGLVNLPDSELPAAAKSALDDELASGQIDPQRGAILQQRFDAANGDPTKIRQQITAGLVGNLAGPQAVAALQRGVTDTDIGGANVPRVTPSPLEAATGQGPLGIQSGPGAINRTQSPTYLNTGGEAVPVGGAAGAPKLTQTLSPGQGTDLQTRLVQQPDGSYAAVTKQLQQWNPGMAPAGAKAGAGGGALGSGGYPAPPATAVPLGAEKQLESDQSLYQADKAAVPQLTTGTQSLHKALDALNAVATGAGTEGVARMRAYATSLGNVLGVSTGGINLQDMNRAQLEKYLTDYARQSGTAGRSDEALATAFKSNASGSINNAAAQDVVRTNIGRDRQKIAAAQLAPNAQGSGYSSFKSSYATNTDPRGFAWDTYTDQQKAAILKEVQGDKGKNSPEYKKLARAVGDAQKLNLLNFSAPAPVNVNQSVPPVPSPARAPAPAPALVPAPALAPVQQNLMQTRQD